MKILTDIETATFDHLHMKFFEIFNLSEKKIQLFEATCLKIALEQIIKYRPQARRSCVSLVIWLYNSKNNEKKCLLYQGQFEVASEKILN